MTPLGSHSHVGSDVVVTAHSQHDLDIGGAVAVGGFVWLQAVDTADRRVVAGVAGSAICDRAGIVLGCVWLSTDSTGVAVSCTSLCGVTIELAFVASGGGAKGDIFGNHAFAVEQSKAVGTERLLG